MEQGDGMNMEEIMKQAQQFQQKLGQYLLRRGFSYEISKIISAPLRQEMGKEGNGSEA